VAARAFCFAVSVRLALAVVEKGPSTKKARRKDPPSLPETHAAVWRHSRCGRRFAVGHRRARRKNLAGTHTQTIGVVRFSRYV